jgi:hypothetical protein
MPEATRMRGRYKYTASIKAFPLTGSFPLEGERLGWG